jgi:hypothetical protein
MTAAFHTIIDHGRPVGPNPRGFESGRAIARALFIDWDPNVPTQTTAAICNSMQGGQPPHTVTGVVRWMGAARESTGLNLVTLDSALATFANSGFCKLSSGQSTSSPTNCSIEVAGWRKWACFVHPLPSKADLPSSTPAAHALARIKLASELTTEALAPLIGVSRRTLHLWFAGGQISQRNEERLRALAEALEAIAAAAPETARQRLMERVQGYPRIYDLLAEGRFEAAVARGTGVKPSPRPLIYPKPHPLSTPLAARVAGSNDRPIPLDGSIDRRITKRLKR